MSDLRSCPWCGGKAIRDPDGEHETGYVHCEICGLGAGGFTGNESAENWNNGKHLKHPADE